MKIEEFLQALPCTFFTGVPDSQLKALCDYLNHEYAESQNHCIAHNEGGALALASGYHLATGKIPCVYMQNSGIGNIVNPVTSLTSALVYAIPTVFVVGWRGEPGVHDEPQHVYMGEVTLQLFKDLDIPTFVVGPDTSMQALSEQMDTFKPVLAAGRSVALIIKKGALKYAINSRYDNTFELTREQAIDIITHEFPKDIFISTTGKASRELFELRLSRKEDHSHDFLTVGSMGHSAMIALGVAQEQPHRRIWSIDGDGAAIMHLGAWAIIGNRAPENLIHVILNNGAHESVGGMPTAGAKIDFPAVALACGYKAAFSVKSERKLIEVITQRITKGPVLIEVKINTKSRDNLIRPTTTPLENKQRFMSELGGARL
ncbi:MAG: phosphonopyruvate decarboxylase [Oscillospiraceae bacterium]|nr:phosphonopyruvate decarboxylase [Oscillospiraceae bacterium]